MWIKRDCPYNGALMISAFLAGISDRWAGVSSRDNGGSGYVERLPLEKTLAKECAG